MEVHNSRSKIFAGLAGGRIPDWMYRALIVAAS